MATTFHLGSYGSGKSYGGLKLGVYDELILGSRGIVTNLSLLQVAKVLGQTTDRSPGLGAINELLHKRFPKQDTRVLQRVRILKEEEVPHFFCHRIDREGNHYDIPVPSPEDEKRGVRPDFGLLKDDGIVYIIDEFHEFYNARAWAEVGRSVGWYKNQQRKLGDDIHACTPQIDEVDKQMRTIGHEYRVYHNLGNRKVRGIVLPQTFICSVYSSLDAVKRRANPISKFPFNLDIELANCYDTAKGVRGIQGGSADIGKRPRGFHWSILPVIMISVIALVIGLGVWGKHVMTRKLNGTVTHTQKLLQSSNLPPSEVPANQPSVRGPTSSQPAAQSASDSTVQAGAPDLPPVAMSGYCKLGDKYIVTLTDGSTYETGDPDLRLLAKTYCIIGTNTFRIQRNDPRLAVAQPNWSVAQNLPAPVYSPSPGPQPEADYSPRPALVYTIPNRSPLDSATGGYRGHPPQDISSRFPQANSQTH